MLNKYFIVNEEKISKNDLKTIYRFFRMGDLKVSEDIINWLYKCARERTNIENKNYLSKASKLLLRKKFKEATDLVKKFYDENHVEKEEIKTSNIPFISNDRKFKHSSNNSNKNPRILINFLIDDLKDNYDFVFKGIKKGNILKDDILTVNYLDKNNSLQTSEFKMDINKGWILNEETTSGDVAPFSSMLLGKPLFRVPDSLFYKIGYSDRNQHGWYKKFYGTELGQWCKENRGKKFTIKHETKDLYIDCEAK